MKTKIIEITPDVARATLQDNRMNRAVRRATVQQYAAEMSGGLWKENGEPIIIGSDNVLIDGQHRLLAIIESGTTQKMIVAYDVDPEARRTVDGGLRRSSSDVLSVEGLQNGHRAGAALAAMINIIRGSRNFTGSVPKELLIGAYFEIEKELHESLNATARARGVSGIPWDRGYWTAALTVVVPALGEERRDRLFDVMCGYGVIQGSFEDKALRRARRVNSIADACDGFAAVQMLCTMAMGRYYAPKAAQIVVTVYEKKAGPAVTRMLEWKINRNRKLKESDNV